MDESVESKSRPCREKGGNLGCVSSRDWIAKLKGRTGCVFAGQQGQ